MSYHQSKCKSQDQALIIFLSICVLFISGCNEQSKPTVTKVVQKELFEKLFDLSTLHDSLLTTTVLCLQKKELLGNLLDKISTSRRWSIGSDTSEVSYGTYKPYNSKSFYRIIYYRVVQYTPSEKYPWESSILVGYPAEKHTEYNDKKKGFYILTVRESSNVCEPCRIESNLSRNALSSIIKMYAYQYSHTRKTIELDYSIDLFDNEFFFDNIKIGEQRFDSYMSGMIKCY